MSLSETWPAGLTGHGDRKRNKSRIAYMFVVFYKEPFKLSPGHLAVTFTLSFLAEHHYNCWPLMIYIYRWRDSLSRQYLLQLIHQVYWIDTDVLLKLTVI